MNQLRLAVLAALLIISAAVCGAAPIPITGKVVDAQGRALPGARVELLPPASSSERQKPRVVVQSDPSGSFSLSAPESTPWIVRIEASGFVPGEIDLPALEAVELPTAALAPDAGLRVSVVDFLGRPVSGARVEVSALSDSPSLQWRSAATAGFTGADGTLVLPRRAEERLVLRAAAPGFVEAREEATRSVARLSLLPRPASGLVVDVSGRPVAEARVSLLPSEETGKPVLASSDRQGRFRIEAVPAAQVDLEVRAPGFVPALIRGLAIAPGSGAFDLGRVTLDPGAVLEGRVEDPDGQPLDGAVVHLRRTDATSERLARAGAPPQQIEAVTGADGRFELGGLREGERAGLFVEKEGYAAQTVSGLVAPAETPVRVVLSLASRLTGRVVDESGAPVEAAQVVLRREDGASRPLAKAGQTDDEGRFTLEGVASGRFALDASAQGYLPAQVEEVEVPLGKDLEVVLRQGAALEGTVTTVEGDPAAGAVVRVLVPPEAQEAQEAQEEDSVTFAVLPETRADAEGRYRLQGLRHSRYSVLAEHPGGQRASQDLEIREDETRLDLRLGGGFEVAGRTVDAAGRAVAGARIGLSSPDGSGRSAASGADGAFRFAGVSEGRHRLQAEKEGYGQPPVQEIQVAGAAVRDVELRLDRGVTVAGQILGLGFQDLARVQVSATRAGIPGEQSGRADSQGRYRIADLEPGEWTLLARLPDGRLARERITVPAGSGEISFDLEFQSGLSLTGRVVAGAAPVAGAVVYARASDGSGTGGGVSGQQGDFRIEGLRPGLYDLTVMLPRDGASRRQTLELSGDREIVIDLTADGP